MGTLEPMDDGVSSSPSLEVRNLYSSNDNSGNDHTVFGSAYIDQKSKCRGWIYIDFEGNTEGPMELPLLKKLLEYGKLQFDHMVRINISNEWVTLKHAESPSSYCPSIDCTLASLLATSLEPVQAQLHPDHPFHQQCLPSLSVENVVTIEDIDECAKHKCIRMLEQQLPKDDGSMIEIEVRVNERVEQLMQGFDILTGEGFSGIVDGCHIRIGNVRLENWLGWTEAFDSDVLESCSNRGDTICLIGVDERPVGIFYVGDQVRPEAVEAISNMKKLGLHIAMLPVDGMAAANVVHIKLWEIHVHAQLLPSKKVQVLRELKKIRMTGMVGDGINNARALVAANLGIAMGVAGSAVAMETADIALMTNDLRKLAPTLGLGRKSLRKIQHNIFISFATKALIIALAAAGYASLWGAVLADVGTCLVVIFNSMILLDRKKVHGACHYLLNDLKAKPDHQEQLKMCSEGRHCCSKAAPLKVSDASPYCKSKRDVSDGLQRLQDPANAASGSNHEDLQDRPGDCW